MDCLDSESVDAEQRVRTVSQPQRVSKRLGGILNLVPIGIRQSRLSSEFGSERDDGRICHSCELNVNKKCGGREARCTMGLI